MFVPPNLYLRERSFCPVRLSACPPVRLSVGHRRRRRCFETIIKPCYHGLGCSSGVPSSKHLCLSQFHNLLMLGRPVEFTCSPIFFVLHFSPVTFNLHYSVPLHPVVVLHSFDMTEPPQATSDILQMKPIRQFLSGPLN